MFVVLLLFSVGLCIADTTGRNLTSNFFREEPCSNAKGFCLLENECHQSVDEESKNLCPNQKSEGAVCCKDFPQENVNCHQQHNSCMSEDDCPQFLNSGRRGCPEKEVCCVLI